MNNLNDVESVESLRVERDQYFDDWRCEHSALNRMIRESETLIRWLAFFILLSTVESLYILAIHL